MSITDTPDPNTYAVHHGNRITVFTPLQAGVDVFLKTGANGQLECHCELHQRRGCRHTTAARREAAKPESINQPAP